MASGWLGENIYIFLILLQETGPTKEPQAFQEIDAKEVVLSVGIYHPRKVGRAFIILKILL